MANHIKESDAPMQHRKSRQQTQTMQHGMKNCYRSKKPASDLKTYITYTLYRSLSARHA